jgi:hypothetical protein
MNSELSGLIATCGHNTAFIGQTTDYHRLALIFGVISLLDRGKKCVHIDMNDLTIFHDI